MTWSRYLNTLPDGAGGETWFPRALDGEGKPITEWRYDYKDCNQGAPRPFLRTPPRPFLRTPPVSEDGDWAGPPLCACERAAAACARSPRATKPPPHKSKETAWASAGPGIRYQPTRGHALLFYSMRADGELEELSMHGGCPVLSDTEVKGGGSFVPLAIRSATAVA
jgi:hypothetical protein